MRKERSAHSKFKLAIALLVVSILAITGALIGVYAASLQGWKADFNIQYELADNIAVEVSAKYQMPGGAEVEVGSTTFQTNSKQSQGSLGANIKLVLSEQQPYVDFTYAFQNLSQTNGVTVAASWVDFTSDLQNILCSYTITTNVTSEEVTLTSAESFSNMAFNLNAGEAGSIKMRFAVDDILLAARVTSSSENGLLFSLGYLEVS
ncbi:MAG: hypothetical protein IJY90_00650 [Clostridia bacterium]|nr:hypothetical protein [Clostridia bacterium]